MRLLDTANNAAWTICDRCGNDYSAGTYRCARCGNAPGVLRRLGNLVRLASNLALAKRGVSRLKRSRGTYPGLEENALRLQQERKKRTTRIAAACAIVAGTMIIYVLVMPYFAGNNSTARESATQTLATGSVIRSEPASAPSVVVSSTDNQSFAKANIGSTQMQNVGASEFYRALQSGNLALAHRRLAGLLQSGAASGDIQQMHVDLAAREHLRDSLLHRAWHCRAIGDWPCVADNATQASTVDVSSGIAKRLVSQASKAVGDVQAQ
jgi:hypothetical protein